jgi:hypothetical protein
MRSWRNRQTRTFEGRVGDRMGSSPIDRTKMIIKTKVKALVFFIANLPSKWIYNRIIHLRYAKNIT